MGLIVLSIMLSIILGCVCWLVLGEKLPLKDETKWPPLNNIVCYAAGLFLPFYLILFFVF